MKRVLTPKEKADYLYFKFLDYAESDSNLKGDAFAKHLRDNARQCALICAKEMIDNEPGIRHILVMEDDETEYEWLEYWNKVKEEIQK